ncbi:DUF4240 domain-containing protein [Lentzea guizhouensis]|uniref:DUF4240 domain-containing protein n=1 Tax=Lentzea guizhouensis TaxID=1586287 RepID=UPI001C54D70C|nr:DUF4240 domain-containing protein [Lentzea guizhouensis]
MTPTAFWQLIADARAAVDDPSDCCAVVTATTARLAALPPAEIMSAQQVFWDLMAFSYSGDLWAAAYVINGGCSDDGFEYFRGWLLTQGEAAYTAAVTTPDTLAGLPAVIAAAESDEELECEAALGIAWDAHLTATGMRLPQDAFTVSYPEIRLDWHDDFDDDAGIERLLPRLTALYDD